MDDLVSQYVDRDKVKSDTDFLIAETERAKAAYDNLAKVKVGVQGSQNLPDLSSNVRQAEKDTQNLIKTQQQLLVTQRQQIAVENELIKQAQLKAKAIADNAREVEKTSKANTAALKKESADAESVSNDYKQLSLAYNDAALKAKNLQIVLGGNHPIAQQATKDAAEQGEYLKKLDESVGQHQRNVGNYSSALTGYANTIRGLRGPTKLLGEALGIGAQEADQFRIVLEHSIQGFAAFFRAKENKAAVTAEETAATEANTTATLQNNAAQQAAENIPQTQSAGATTTTETTNGANIAATEADTVATEANIAAHQESNAVLAQSVVTTEAEAIAQAELLAASTPTAIALQAETVANAELGVTAGAAAIGLQAEAIATTEVAVATTVASGAMRAFRVAVAATGIGLLLVAIGLIIYKIVEYRKSLAEANEMTKLFADVNADAAKNAGKESGSLQVLKAEIENVLIPMDKRLQAIKNLKDQYPDLLKNTTDEALLQGKAAASYDLVAASILKKAQAQAAEAKIQELVSANLEIELKNDAIAEATNKKIRDTKEDVTIASGGSFGGGNYGGASKAAKQKAILDEYNDIKAGNEKLVGLNNAKIQSLLKLAAVEENIAKDPDKKEKAGAKNLDSAKELLDAEFEAYKKSQTEKIAILADEVKDTKLSYEQRLQAQKDYTDASIDLTEAKAVQDIKKSNEKEAVLKANLSKETGTQKSNTLIELHNLEVEKQNIRSQAAIDERTELRKNEEVINAILQEQAKHYLEIQRNKYNAALKLIEEQTFKEKALNDNQYNEGVDGLNAKLAIGEISEREYNHKKLDLDFAYAVASLAIEEDRIRKLIALRAIFGQDVSKELLSLADLERKIKEASLKHTKLTEEEKRKEIVKTLDTIKTVSTDVFNLIGGALNASAVTQKNALKAQSDEAEKKAARDIELVNASTLSQQDKAAKIIVINARLQAQKDQIAQKQKIADEQKAKFDKATAIFNIVIATATAVVKSLPNVILAAAVGALGAAELAVAIATPIPKFKHGKSASDNYEGMAIVGDGGKHEVIGRANGSFELTPNTDTLTHIGKNDIVYQDIEAWEKALHQSAHNGISERMSGRPVKQDNGMIKLMAEQNNILKKIADKPNVSIGASDKAVTVIWEWSAKQISYLDQNTQF